MYFSKSYLYYNCIVAYVGYVLILDTFFPPTCTLPLYLRRLGLRYDRPVPFRTPRHSCRKRRLVSYTYITFFFIKRRHSTATRSSICFIIIISQPFFSSTRLSTKQWWSEFTVSGPRRHTSGSLHWTTTQRNTPSSSVNNCIRHPLPPLVTLWL